MDEGATELETVRPLGERRKAADMLVAALVCVHARTRTRTLDETLRRVVRARLVCSGFG